MTLSISLSLYPFFTGTEVAEAPPEPQGLAFSPALYGFFLGTETPAAPQTRLPNILQSIQSRLDSIPEFSVALPGGYFTGPPSPDADDNPPYLVITRIGGTDTDWVTAAGENGAYIQGPIKTAFEDTFQTTLVGYDFDQLDLIHDLWTDNFNARMNPLVIRRRLFRGLFNKEPTYDFGDSPGDPQGGNMVVYRWEFSIVTTLWER